MQGGLGREGLLIEIESIVALATSRLTIDSAFTQVGQPSREGLRPGNSLLGWRSLVRETESYCGPDGCIGTEMLLEPHVHVFAEIFRRCRD